MDFKKAVIATIKPEKLSTMTTGIGHEISQRVNTMLSAQAIIEGQPVEEVLTPSGVPLKEAIFQVAKKQNDHKNH